MRDCFVMIGIPSASGVFHYSMVDALMNLDKPENTVVQIVPRMRTDKVRNHIVRKCLEGTCSHLFFVDDDNPPPRHALTKLLEADKDIVCGTYPTRNLSEGKRYLTILQKNGEGIESYQKIEKINKKDAPLFEVAACGMGCTLIKRKVLEDMWEKHNGRLFEFLSIEKDGIRITMGEDIVFCDRAKELGFEVWCDTEVRPAHLGEPEFYILDETYTT